MKREVSLPGQKAGSILFLFGAYQIGKERVFLSVANHLEEQVHVDRQRQRGMLQVGDLCVLKWLEEPAIALGGWGISDRTRVDVMRVSWS